MVEVISRPVGNKLSEDQLSAVVVDNGAGEAVVYVAGGHSLSDGDYVYIESNIEAYNGFKYVDATSYDYFKIKDSEGGESIPYYQDADITFYVSVNQHGWQCVHLPIAYELQSDVWPNNVAEEEYNPNTVVSQANSNGYTQLNLLGALSDPTSLTYIELVGDGPLSGSYQIIDVLQPWSVVINLAYNASNSFTGYVVVKYYNNYHIVVEVWSGLESGHRWESLKPFEVASVLKLIPDSSGSVKFSIHEILKGFINTRNHLTLETLPNNTDFHISFYIKYYEAYDQSDGEEITIFEGSTEDDSDNFVGHAVNAMLPFKSLNSGFMSDYIEPSGAWLTLFDRPVAIVGQFFDLSFINSYNFVDISIIVNGEINQTISNPGNGLIRVPFEFDESGEKCIHALISGDGELNLSSFENHPITGGSDWTTGITPSVSTGGVVGSDILYELSSLLIGGNYNFSMSYTVSGGGGIFGFIRIRALDASFNSLDIAGSGFVSGGSYTLNDSMVIPEGTNYIGITVQITGATRNVTIQSLSYSLDQAQVTQSICIDVVEECGSTFNSDQFRLTEGNDLRELE